MLVRQPLRSIHRADYRHRLAVLRLVGGTSLVAIILAPAPADAQPVGALGSGSVYAAVSGLPAEQRLFGPTSTAGPLSVPALSVEKAGMGAAAAASLSGDLQPGRIAARVSGESSATGAGSGIGFAQVQLSWTDRLTVTGPPGIYVELLLTATFGAAVVASPLPTGAESCRPTEAVVSMSVSLGFEALAYENGVGHCSTQYLGTPTQSVRVLVLAGQSASLSASMRLIVNAYTGDLGPEGIVPSASALIDATRTMTFAIDVVTPGASYTTASGASYASPGGPPPVSPAVLISSNRTTYLPGQTVLVGVQASLPSGQPAAHLYAGALLPDGTIAFLTGPNLFGGLGRLSAPATFIPLQSMAPGSSVSLPSLLVLVIPPGVIPPGTYQLFAALAPAGAFADNRIDPGDILAVDVRPVTILP